MAVPHGTSNGSAGTSKGGAQCAAIQGPWGQTSRFKFLSSGGLQTPPTKTSNSPSHYYPKYEIWLIETKIVRLSLWNNIGFSRQPLLSPHLPASAKCTRAAASLPQLAWLPPTHPPTAGWGVALLSIARKHWRNPPWHIRSGCPTREPVTPSRATLLTPYILSPPIALAAPQLLVCKSLIASAYPDSHSPQTLRL